MNQVIGIAGVFALTLFLLVLRHYFLSLGRVKRGGYVNPTAPSRNFELKRKAVEDDSWLLWTPDPDPRAGSSKRGGNR